MKRQLFEVLTVITFTATAHFQMSLYSLFVVMSVFGFGRYSSKWIDEYEGHLRQFFDELSATLPKETLVIWSLTMPLGEKIRGGFLVPEV